MIQVANAIEFGLKHDPIVRMLVGMDDEGQVKVYDSISRSKTAPFFVFSMIPSAEGPAGHYGDLRAIETPTVQVTGWGRTRREAWLLYEAAQEALERADLDDELLPYTLMAIKRVGTSPGFPDEESHWWQVPALYQIALSR